MNFAPLVKVGAAEPLLNVLSGALGVGLASQLSHRRPQLGAVEQRQRLIKRQLAIPYRCVCVHACVHVEVRVLQRVLCVSDMKGNWPRAAA